MVLNHLWDDVYRQLWTGRLGPGDSGHAIFGNRKAPRPRGIAPERWHDLGNLLLALVMFWAYLWFSQFLLIWSENLADRDPVVFASHRRRMGVGRHRVDTLSVWIAFRFAAVAHCQTQLSDTGDGRRGDPFHALAGHDLDDRAVFLSGGISPPMAGYRGAGGIGGLWLAAFIGHLKARSLLPLHDPRFTAFSSKRRKPDIWRNPTFTAIKETICQPATS